MSRFDNQSVNYDHLQQNLRIVRDRLQHPLTLAEKIVYSHLDDAKNQVRLCFAVMSVYQAHHPHTPLPTEHLNSVPI
jgi:hypothetical protein